MTVPEPAPAQHQHQPPARAPSGRTGPTPVGIALVARNGAYLVRQRPAGSAMAGYWEFPGGKCEPGEPPAAATARECREETGLEVIVGPLRREIEYRYPHDWVRLSYYDCVTRFADAEPDPGSGFRWVPAQALRGLRFPEANEPVLEALAEIPASANREASESRCPDPRPCFGHPLPEREGDRPPFP